MLVRQKSKTLEEQYTMKKHTLTVTLIAAALVGGALAAETPLPSASPGPYCRASSWNPEQYTFYGAKDIIVEKLAKIPAKLSERRVFLQVTQGDSSAEIKLYEQQKDSTFTIMKWSTRQTSCLLADIDRAIVTNKGVNCVGEQVKDILAKELGEGQVSEAVAAPVSAEAAFAHSVKEASGEFIKSTVTILC